MESAFLKYYNLTSCLPPVLPEEGNVLYDLALEVIATGEYNKELAEAHKISDQELQIFTQCVLEYHNWKATIGDVDEV